MFEAHKAMIRRINNIKEYQQFFRGDGIDIGAGSDCIDAFIQQFPQMRTVHNYDLRVAGAEKCGQILDNSYNFLHSSHWLEHFSDPTTVVNHWVRVVKVGGFIIITVPDEHMYEKDMWPSPFNSRHQWSFRFGGNSERSTSIDAIKFFNTIPDVSVISIKRVTENYFETDEDLTARTDINVECGIEIILKKTKHTAKPIAKWNLNPFCFMLNSLAMGDVIAAVPVVKHMIDNYYTEPGSYYVVAKEMFRPLFWFVPDQYFHNFEQPDNNWDIPKGFAIGILNQKTEVGTGVIRNTPKAIHLAQFASFKLVDRLLDKKDLNYVPLPTVDVSRFGVDFSKTVVLITSYRDVTRMWKAEYMLEVAAWIRGRGLTPVFIGKTDMNLDSSVRPKTSLPDDVSEYGLDLRNQTNMLELTTICGLSKAVVGLDSGPIHLAGTTKVPIVCGYTSVSPEYRIPIREEGITYPVSSGVPCDGCESKWAGNFWNYENCYLGTNACCENMTADRFIEKLELFL